jgi:hypothetical protein
MECQWAPATSIRTVGRPSYREVYVCLVSETHFTKQSYVKFRGYKVNHTIHPENTARGRSAVIFNENIHHYEETKYDTEGI